MGTIRILLADDHKLIRRSLRSLVDKCPGMAVVAEAADGREAVRLAAELRPDVVVMDLEMPRLNGIEATRQIVSRVRGVRVVALTAYADGRRTIQMFKAGASGYVPKAAAFQELCEAVRTAASGDRYVSPTIAGFFVGCAARTADAGDDGASSVLDKLTSREREVLQLLAEGNAAKQVAAVLHVCVKTAEAHRSHIMEKLGVDSIAALTKLAIREGVTALHA